MTVAENIKNIIDDNGYKQKTIAKKAGWKEKRFSDLLNERMTFKVEYLPAICMALNKTPDEVLNYNDSQKGVG